MLTRAEWKKRKERIVYAKLITILVLTIANLSVLLMVLIG